MPIALDGDDYVLEGGSAWITVRGISVYIVLHPGVVYIDVFPVGHEGMDPIRSERIRDQEVEEAVRQYESDCEPWRQPSWHPLEDSDPMNVRGFVFNPYHQSPGADDDADD